MRDPGHPHKGRIKTRAAARPPCYREGMAEEPARPDPDALLALAGREGRGRLKVFLGAAPGVGKTMEMLAEARRRLAGGGPTSWSASSRPMAG